jgi:hypothetical protein
MERPALTVVSWGLVRLSFSNVREEEGNGKVCAWFGQSLRQTSCIKYVELYLGYCVPTCFTTYPTAMWRYFHGTVKRPECEANQSPPSSADVWMAWNSTSSDPLHFMARCLFKTGTMFSSLIFKWLIKAVVVSQFVVLFYKTVHFEMQGLVFRWDPPCNKIEGFLIGRSNACILSWYKLCKWKQHIRY